jgi:hypothetical protein
MAPSEQVCESWGMQELSELQAESQTHASKTVVITRNFLMPPPE